MFFSRIQKTLMLGLLFIGMSSTSYAELFTNPVKQLPQGEFSLSGFFSPSSTITYDFGADVDIDRSYLGLSGTYGLFRQLDVYLSMVPVLDIDNGDFDGQGFTIGFGSRYEFNLSGLDFHGYTQIHTINEEYEFAESGDPASDIGGFELSSGLMSSIKLNQITAYAGPELVVLSDFEVDASGQDFERASGFILRGGMNYEINRKMSFFADAAIFNEKTLTLGVETRL